MSKLADFVGHVKCGNCGREFFKGLKGVITSCPGCGDKFLLKAIEDGRLLEP
jgi:predicted  nucleic acid-binding Zn-ribbon protein